MKIINKLAPKTLPTIKMKEIPIGTFFFGYVENNEEYKGCLLFCTYDKIVMINNPRKTWCAENNFAIIDYQPVEVELTITKIL